ncbi:uncharacterized protein LOC131939240 [Physella acuta]|uniref:uncharacterized protein LOC131939240 n=1 Tax=Physella acuta TaxID=109671 RepID=UPI0027DD19BF|nr:uncharacterized protein LOC131939240 [Physella acuta]
MSLVKVYAALFCFCFVLGIPVCWATPQPPSHTHVCEFTPTNETQFIDSIYQFFNKDSGTRILEYHVKFVNVSSDFDLSKRSRKDAFQPWRWFRTQGVGSSQLLLVNTYYYGLLKPFATVGIAQRDVVLSVSPSDCLDDLKDDQLDNMLRDYLLRDFDVDGATVKHPFKYSDAVEICTALVDDDDGWGRLVYRCCGYDYRKHLYCDDVYNGDWVWALQIFILTLTVIIFLYIPLLIPEGYRYNTYCYFPADNLTFKIVCTHHPEEYRTNKKSLALRRKQWEKMTKVKKFLPSLVKDVVYLCHVKKVEFSVNMDKLLVEGGSTINSTKALFNAFIRCKIRQSEPLEDCCRYPACGTICCTHSPPWNVVVRAFRTLFVMTVLVIPSLPFMYAMAADDLDFQFLGEAFESRGLQRKFNFYTGRVSGKIIVAVISIMYILHCALLIIDGATTETFSQLYNEIFDLSWKKQLRQHVTWVRYQLKRLRMPIKRCGIFVLPIWILAAILFPMYVMMSIIYHAPMLQLVVQVIRKSYRRVKSLKQKPNDRIKAYNGCQLFWFFFTILFVFIVLTIGTNFLVHVLAMVIVTVVVEADLIYRILPVVLLFFMYIRDSYSRVGLGYDAFYNILLDAVKSKEQKAVKAEAMKPRHQQTNRVFKVDVEKLDDASETDGADDMAVDVAEVPVPQPKRLFNVKHGNIRLHQRQLLLFLTRDDFLHMSEKFFFHCCTMDCAGSPGPIVESYVKATLEVVKIGIFLLFVFLVVMAYGSSYYISPANHLFVTLISGLVPLIIRNVFCLAGATPVETVNTKNYRFEAQLKEKIETFGQSWDVKDMTLANPSPNNNMYDESELSETGSPGDVIDLILDLNGSCTEEEIQKVEEADDDLQKLEPV